MDSFSQYIEQQRAAGSVESAGSFTLAIEKARDKLSSYSLANPEDYILKLVQCAVALEVKKLNLGLTRNTVLLHFEVDESDDTLSVESLTNSLVAPLDETNKARSHLSLALCSIAGLEPVELMWGAWDSEGGLILSLGHGRSELFRGVPFPRTEPLAEGRKLHLLFLKKQSSNLPLSQTAGEWNALSSSCGFAPINLELDGSKVNPKFPIYVSPSDPVRQLTSLYLGALSIKSGRAAPLSWTNTANGGRGFGAQLPAQLQQVATDIPPVLHLERPEFWSLPLKGTVKFTKILGIPNYLYGPSQIFYVKDGVLMRPMEVHSNGGGAFAILDGNHLKTDLTGLQIVEEEQVQNDIDQTVIEWKRLVDAFVNANPPIYHSDLVSSGEDALFGRLLGPLGKLLRPTYDYLTQKPQKRALQLKKYHRQMQTRRGYLAYFKNPPPEPGTP